MTALYIVLALILLTLLTSLIRVGARVCFDEDGLRVSVRLGPTMLQVFPMNLRTRKQGAGKKKTKKKTAKPKPDFLPQTLGGKWELVKQFLPVVSEAAGAFKRKLRINELKVHLTWAASDPADAALGYGRASMAMGMVWPLFEHNFNVKKHDLHIDVSYTQPRPTILLSVQLTLTIGQATRLMTDIGLRVLKIFMQYRKTQKKEKAVQQA